MNVNESKTWRMRRWLMIYLPVCIVAMYVLTYGLDLDSHVKWGMRWAISVLLSGLAVFILYVLYRVIQKSAWHGVIAFVLMVLMLLLSIRTVANFTSSSIPDLGTAHLYLRMPIAVSAGLFGGVGSLLLARAFWFRSRNAMNLIASGYFAITGLALMIGYFLIDLLAGFMRLFSVSL